MLNILWSVMMLTGILWAGFHGTLGAVTDGAFEAAKEAVTLCLTMLGILSFWNGILRIGYSAGLITQLCQTLQPILSFLFPAIPKNHPALEAISANFIANLLGLGWAATPAGLTAMEQLEALEQERRTQHVPFAAPSGCASNEMCTFLIINISSLQLIPVNMIAYRTEYGSAQPLAILGPALIATSISTLVGVLFCKIIPIHKHKV